jgi:hypothetical protein
MDVSVPASRPSDGTLVVEPGAQLGKYQIIEKLATGGMAEIFLARATGMLGFQKLVVIKRILPHLASRTDFIEMFLDEARIATTLNHPNVVQTYEVGVFGKSYFLVMEHLAGQDVRTMVRAQEKALPIEHAVGIAIGVAAGLHYAHDKNDFDGKPLTIVHRDVTPQNVIVTYDGAVKLLDFGIAKASSRMNETRDGSFKGKVPYMSPEQCRGEQLDRRTDVFSLGILLWEMSIGRRLFRGKTDFEILKQIVEGDVCKPSAVDPAYDTALEAIVMKALERKPAARFQTARELQEALEEWVHSRRIRLSQLALADYMHALFADKAGAWKRVADEGDAEKLAGHVAELAAEREADVEREEQALAELPPLPVSEPRRSRTPLYALALLTCAVGAAAWWKLHGAPLPKIVAPPPMSIAAPKANSDELRAPETPVEDKRVGSMRITTTPAGASLVLDGTTLPEKSPALLAGIAPGASHTLEVKLAGHSGVAQRFMLEAGEEAEMEIALHREHHHHSHAAAPAAAPAPPPQAATPAPAPAPPAGDGTLIVSSSPWCNVTIDGKPRGTTPLKLTLKSGPHQIALANPQYKIQRTLSIELQPGQTLHKTLDFAPED